MKKSLFFTFLLACLLALVVFICGCSMNTTPDNAPDSDDMSVMSMESKQAIFNGSYGETSGSTTYYGVGRALDVIKDEYITVSAGYSKVFDTDKLLALNWHQSKTGKMDAQSVYGSSMEKYYANLMAQFNYSFGTKIGYGPFSAGINNKFGFTADIEYKQVANEIYYTFSQMYAAQLIEIDEYYDISQFEKILSASVLQDAAEVQSGAMSPSAFINKYGTHVVLAGYYGGRVECDYYLCNHSKQWDAGLELNIKNGISASLKDVFGAEQETDFSVMARLGLDSENTQEVFMASSLGGANFQASSVKEFTANYGAWVESMNSETEYGNLVELPSRSLVSVWELLPNEYAIAKNKLSAYFDEVADSANKEFLDKYERHFTKPEEIGDTSDFESGYGTIESPYVITSKEQFLNINKDNRNNKCFALGCSVNLGIWNEPFEFSGKLNGNGYTVSYTQTLSLSGNYSGGLFTRLNNAEVKNLKIDVRISRDKDSSAVGKVGALAGETDGICKVCQVAVSGTISIGNYSGYDYVGGIIGKFLGGEIDQCANVAQVTNWARNARTGGICGYASPSKTSIVISNCYNRGSLKSSSAWTAAYGGRTSGGIVGQVRGHNAFTLKILNCYNDSKVRLEWTKSSTGGWYAVGGICGDVENGVDSNISVKDCHWNSSKSDRTGNNKKFNANGTKNLENADFSKWSTDIWSIQPNTIPKLLWC